MDHDAQKMIERTKTAALEVLLHNAHGPYRGLPRTAGWGYPEPYTRDLMISSLGILTTGNEKLIKAIRRSLETAARNQSRLGHISSLIHDPHDRGASDCTPSGWALCRSVGIVWNLLTPTGRWLVGPPQQY